MTERLSALLHDEARELRVPPPPTDRVLAAGRSVRRRRRNRAAVTMVAAVVAVAALLAAAGQRRPARTPEPAQRSDRAAYGRLGAWADGDRLHIGRHTVTVPGIRELRYTTAGVVATGSEGPVLVTPSGEVEPLGLDLLTSPLDDPPIATDPTSGNVGYVRDLGRGRAQAVVLDLVAGEETAVGAPFSTRQADGVRWLAGDLMSYARRGEGQVVDWRTGAPSRLARLARTGWWQGAGVSIDYAPGGSGRWTLNSFAGDLLLTVDTDPASSYGTLSPDGRYFAVSDTDPGVTVYDLSDGSTATVVGTAGHYGWTPDGHLVGRTDASSRQISTCDPETGRCEGTGTTAGGRLVVVRGTGGTG